MHFLPRIVVKSPEGDFHVSRIEKEPLDEADIARLWKIFNVVRRTIMDPTSQADRLENFWWRVWGSKQKHLSGLSLGKLCSGISDESSHERLCLSPGTFKNTHSTKGTSNDHERSCIEEKEQGSATDKPMKSLSSNKLKTIGMPPHPILKKTRVTSSIGPRPTARFISPHETEDEDPNAHLRTKIIPQPALNSLGGATSERKRRNEPNTSKKKGAFLITKKKQAVILRRQSPSLSTDAASKVLGPTRAASATPASIDETDYMSSRQFSGRVRSQDLEVSSSMSNTGLRNTILTSLRPDPSIPTKEESTLQKQTFVESFEIANTEEYQQKLSSAILSNSSLGESNEDKLSCGSNNSFSDKPPPSSQRAKLLAETTPGLNEESLVHTSSFHPNSGDRSMKTCPQGRERSEKELNLWRDKADDNFASFEKAHDIPSLTSSTRPTIDKVNKRENYPFSTATRFITKSHNSNQNKSRPAESIKSENVFVKIPIQSTPKTLTSIEELSRSKSQLTLLLEKDRANLGEKSSKNVE